MDGLNEPLLTLPALVWFITAFVAIFVLSEIGAYRRRRASRRALRRRLMTLTAPYRQPPSALLSSIRNDMNRMLNDRGLHARIDAQYRQGRFHAVPKSATDWMA